MNTGTRRVFCIGETVLDIIFQDDQPIAAKPGGSMLNSAVSLGRAGISAYFISDFGMDYPGDMIHKFLLQNGISTEYIHRYSDGKTTLALAFLDQRHNADYTFYKLPPAERLAYPMPSIKPGDVLLFGSFYALTGSLRRKLIEFVQHAKSNGAFIIYDPNFRSAHLAELDALRPWILENVSMADLVRGSDEDFRNIFDATTAFEAFQHVNDAGCPLLIYTRNSKGVDIISNGHARSYEVPQIKPLSTIGAGDSFNAGIIYAMVKDGDFMVDFSEFSWDRIIGYAVRFSADVCQNFDNYISLDFANQLK